MSLRFRLVALIIFITLLFFFMHQVRSRRLDLRYSLSWILINLSLIILVVFPGLLIRISRILGIYSPVNMIFFCGFLFSLIIIYSLTKAVSKMSEEIKRLSQKIALMDQSMQIESVHKENENEG